MDGYETHLLSTGYQVAGFGVSAELVFPSYIEARYWRSVQDMDTYTQTLDWLKVEYPEEYLRFDRIRFKEYCRSL